MKTVNCLRYPGRIKCHSLSLHQKLIIIQQNWFADDCEIWIIEQLCRWFDALSGKLQLGSHKFICVYAREKKLFFSRKVENVTGSLGENRFISLWSPSRKMEELFSAFSTTFSPKCRMSLLSCLKAVKLIPRTQTEAKEALLPELFFWLLSDPRPRCLGGRRKPLYPSVVAEKKRPMIPRENAWTYKKRLCAWGEPLKN